MLAVFATRTCPELCCMMELMMTATPRVLVGMTGLPFAPCALRSADHWWSDDLPALRLAIADGPCASAPG